MDTNKIIIAMAVAIAACFAFTACTAAGLFDHHCDVDDTDTVYHLYIGLSDSSTGEEYDPDEAIAQVNAIVLKYGEGLTVYKSQGAWIDDEGTVNNEPSLVYVLSGYTLDDVHAICDQAKALLHQTAIMVTGSDRAAEFYRSPPPNPFRSFSDSSPSSWNIT